MSGKRGLRIVLRGVSIALLGLAFGIVLCAGLIWDGLQLEQPREERAEARRRRFAAALVGFLRKLGATYIKVGQIMSTRPDLLPGWLCNALSELQDDVGGFPFHEVQRALEAEFHRPPSAIFSVLDEKPLASASVAQVHRGQLQNGQSVAVKVRRPGLEELVAFDLAVVRWAGRMIDRLPFMQFVSAGDSADAFAEGIQLQLDFQREAANNRRFQRNFAGRLDVRFPRLVEELCGAQVLTMELVGGVKLREALAAWTAGQPPPLLAQVDRLELARVGVRAMMQMVFIDGFVHADLHPGNIFVQPDGSWMVVDLGLVAELADVAKRGFTRFFAAWATRDGEAMARTVIELAGAPKVADWDGFVRDIQRFLGQYYGRPLREIHMAVVVVDMLRLLRRHRVKANPEFTLVNMAIAVTEGIGRQLDPDLDLLGLALPFFAEHGILGSHA